MLLLPSVITAALFFTAVTAIGNDLIHQVKLTCVATTTNEYAELVKFAHKLQVDNWEEVPRAFPAIVNLRVYSNQVISFQKRFKCPKVSKLPAPPPPSLKSRFDMKTDFFVDYRSFAEQESWLKLQTANNIRAKLSSMGTSLEGRNLWVVHLSNDFTNKTRKSIWINGGQHAREWLAPAACLYLIQYALSNPTILNKFNLLIAPNLNPDGYEYSRLSNRYWRKNKRTNKDGTIGVDLNRNWDFKWNQINGGGSTGSEVYPGTGPASEPEVLFTSNYILANRTKIAAGIDVHTYGELVLRNYGWTMLPSRDEVKLKRFGDAMARAAQQVANESYSSQRSAGLYPTSGSLDDWFYEKAGFPGFTFEMRDSGGYGFVCPPSYIIPNGKELVQAIQALIAQL